MHSWHLPGNGCVSVHQNPCVVSVYRVGSDADGWSDEFSFIAPPKENQHMTFLMFNDVGIKLPSVYNDICSVNDTRFCNGSECWSDF